MLQGVEGDGTEQTPLVLETGRSLVTFEIIVSILYGRWNPNCRGEWRVSGWGGSGGSAYR